MYTAFYKKSGKYYSAWVMEVPGLNAQGRTKKEAEKNLKQALILELYARNKSLRKKLGNSKIIRETLVLVG